MKVHHSHNKEFLSKMFQFMVDNKLGIMEFEHKGDIEVGLYVSYRIEHIKNHNSDEYSFTLYINKDFKGYADNYQELVSNLDEIELFDIINFKEMI